MAKFFKMAVATAAALFAMQAQADIVIDTFTADTFSGVNKLNDFSIGGPVVQHSTAAAVSESLIVGGYRDVFVNKLVDVNGSGDAVGVSVAGGFMNFSQDTGIAGTAIIRWDGANSAVGVDTSGLGDKDFTSGVGFQLIYNTTDDGLEVTFEVWDMSGNHGTFSVVTDDGTQAGTDQVFFLPFAIFEAQGVDFEHIGALQATINTTNINLNPSVAIDLSVRQAFIPVPEPTSIALAGLALLGLGIAKRRNS